MSAGLVIFDCDGVLVDSEPLANRVLASVLTEMGCPTTPQDCIDRYTGMNVRTVRGAVEERFGRGLPEDFETVVRSRAHAALEDELCALPGAAALLAGFPHERCVASNSGPDWVRRALGATNLARYFAADAIFSAADVTEGKPAPDLFLHAAQSMGHGPKVCVVIEDSILGVRAGVAAGMTVLGFTGASHIADGHGERLRATGAADIFDDLTALPALLEAF
jgi:HAD superfamily hydrolase (TIGR01509 family)